MEIPLLAPHRGAPKSAPEKYGFLRFLDLHVLSAFPRPVSLAWAVRLGQAAVLPEQAGSSTNRRRRRARRGRRAARAASSGCKPETLGLTTQNGRGFIRLAFMWVSLRVGQGAECLWCWPDSSRARLERKKTRLPWSGALGLDPQPTFLMD